MRDVQKSSAYEQHEEGEYDEEAEVESRENANVVELFIGVVIAVFAEGYERGERGDKGARAAYVHAHEQRGIIGGELREQYSGGHV